MQGREDYFVKFLVYRQILEIVKARGFPLQEFQNNVLLVDENNDEQLNWFYNLYEHFAGQTKPSLSNLTFYAQKGSELIAVSFFGDLHESEKQVSSSRVADIFKFIDSRPQPTQMIMVIPAKLAIKAESDIDIHRHWYPITVYFESELLHNPNDHVFNPPHEKLNFASREEKKAFFNELNLARGEADLSIIKESDPIVKMFGYPVGSILRFTRDATGLELPSSKIISYRRVAADDKK